MRFRILIAAVSISLLAPITAHSAELSIIPDLKTAKTAHQNRNYTVAAQNWMPLAHHGIAEAQLQLGKLYDQGLGVKQDHKKALNLFIAAAEQGDAKAMFEIGRYYEKGTAVSKDIKKAAEWYQLSAVRGYARGDFLIGQMHEKNKFNPLTPISAETKSFIKQSVQNIKDGNYTAAEDLGNLYQNDMKVPQDTQKALTYLIVAKQNGSSNAAKQVNVLKAKVSDAEYKEAQKNAILLLSNSEKELKETRKDLITTLKRITPPSLSQTEKDTLKTNAAKHYERAAQAGYRRAQEKIAKINGTDLPKKEQTAKKKYRITNSLKTQFSGEDNLDLDTNGGETETSIAMTGQVGTFIHPTENVTAHLAVRGLYSDGRATSDSNDEDFVDLNFLEIRNAWVRIDNLCNVRPASLTVGRQRIKEEKQIWWNRDIDAVKLALDSTLTSGFVAIGENQSKYRIGDDNDLERNEEYRLRVMGELSHSYAKNHVIEARLLFENDYSGAQSIGSTIPTDDRDGEDNKLLWSGIRAKGKFTPAYFPTIDTVNYRADIMHVMGKEDITTTVSGPGAGISTITGTTERDVAGWAFDGNIDIKLDIPLDPTLRLGYAYGSGDNGTGDDTSFRQTGLQGNRSAHSNSIVSGTMRNYGEVLRPELSNIHIANLGLHAPLLKHSDLHVNYFSYWLDENATSLRSSSITAPLNGQDNYLGQALDIAADINLGAEIATLPRAFKSTALRIRLGGFKAGDAYGAAKGEYAYRASTELRVKF